MLLTWDCIVPLPFVCLSLLEWHMHEKSTNVKFGLFVLAINWTISSPLPLLLQWIPHLDKGQLEWMGKVQSGLYEKIFMIVIIRDTWFIQERLSKKSVTGGNIQEARLLATCLVEGGSQCCSGLLLTIQCYACHGGSHIAGRTQNKLRWT